MHGKELETHLFRHCESAAQLCPPCELGLHEHGEGSSLRLLAAALPGLKHLCSSSNFGGCPAMLSAIVLCSDVLFS